jgi:hypothetical protein
MQVGHLERRGNYLTRWNVKNAGLICVMCNNNFTNQKKELLAKSIDDRWGRGTSAKMRILAFKSFRKTITFVEEQVEKLQNYCQE